MVLMSMREAQRYPDILAIMTMFPAYPFLKKTVVLQSLFSEQNSWKLKSVSVRHIPALPGELSFQ